MTKYLIGGLLLGLLSTTAAQASHQIAIATGDWQAVFPDKERPPGAFICTTMPGVQEIYQDELRYLSVKRTVSQWSPKLREMELLSGFIIPSEPIPDAYGCALVPSGSLLVITAKDGFDGSFQLATVTLPNGETVHGVTMRYMLQEGKP